MWRNLLWAALAVALAGCANNCAPASKFTAATPGAEPPPIPPLVQLPPPPVPETDVFAMLAAQRGGQPSLDDVALAARYYCSTRAKLSQYIAREQPPELVRKAMPSYDLITYQCVAPPANN